MKIYFNKPKDNWISPYTIVEKIIFWREIDYDEPLVENIIKYTQLGLFCSILFDIRQFFNRDIRYVKIDAWDTWSMDTTLNRIILPMLKQLKKDKHGAPHVDNEDVPPNLRDKRRVQPKNGRVVIWPSQWTHVHRGNPPLKGNKYIATSWIHYTSN